MAVIGIMLEKTCRPKYSNKGTSAINTVGVKLCDK